MGTTGMTAVAEVTVPARRTEPSVRPAATPTPTPLAHLLLVDHVSRALAVLEAGADAPPRAAGSGATADDATDLVWLAGRSHGAGCALLRARARALQGSHRPPDAGVGDPTAAPADIQPLDEPDAVADALRTMLRATDGGRVAVSLARATPLVLAEARSALAWALDHDELDRAGELLAAWPLLGVLPDRVARFALDVLHGATGVIGGDPAGPAIRPPHPIVVGRLAALHLQYGARRDARIAARSAYVARGVRGVVDPPAWAPALAGLVGERSHRPRWQHRLDGLDHVEVAALSPMLVDVALLRAVERDDKVALRAVLALVVDHGLEITPFVRATATLAGHRSPR
jgi:hypothetical protein